MAYKESTLVLRLSNTEKEAWQKAAEGREMSLSEFVRWTINVQLEMEKARPQ